jgi:hypothetical protein
MGFKDFHPEIWFKNRGYKNIGKVTKEDINIWMSHMPEYLEVAKKLIKDKQLFFDKTAKKWFGIFPNGVKSVNPTEYIVANSNNFKKSGLIFDGDTYFSGMSLNNYNKLLNNGGKDALNWTTTAETYAEDIANNTIGPVVHSIVGNTKKTHYLLPYKGNTRPDPSNYSAVNTPVGAVINNKTKTFLNNPLDGTVDIPEIYTRETKSSNLPSKWRIFGPNV